MALSRRERTGRTYQELIDELEVHLDEDEYGWCTEIAFDIAQIGFKNGDLERSRAFIDEVAKPIAQYYHDSKIDGSKAKNNGNKISIVQQNFDAQYWMDQLKEWEGKNHGNHISPKSSSITQLRDQISKNDGLNVDVICGVATGGIAPAASVDDIFESAITDYPRFSPYRQNDEIVKPDLDREFDGLDVLIVDDIVESGQTFRKMAQYYLENGAEEVYLASASTNKWDLFESGEIYRV